MPQQHQLFAPIKQDESYWTLEDGALSIQLLKRDMGESWSAAFKDHEGANVLQTEEDKKRLMLERFQLEHPGFDFSSAEFNGSAPNPREFMGGINRP